MYPLLAFQRRMWETSPGFEVTPYLSYWMRWKMIWSQQNKDTDPCNNKAPFPSGISILSPCSVARSFNVLSWSVVLKAGCMENPYMLGSTLSYWKKGFYNIVNLTNVLGAIYCTHFQVVSTWAHTVYRNGKVHTHTHSLYVTRSSWQMWLQMSGKRDGEDGESGPLWVGLQIWLHSRILSSRMNVVAFVLTWTIPLSLYTSHAYCCTWCAL